MWRIREDDSRVREPVARENLAVLRHIALNRLKNDPTKLGIQNKRLKAGWDERYLAKLLFEDPAPPSKRKTSGASNISGLMRLPWGFGPTGEFEADTVACPFERCSALIA